MEINKASAEIRLGPVLITIKQGTEEAPLTKEQTKASLQSQIEQRKKELADLVNLLKDLE